MTFLNLSLLAGLGLAALPVVLHLLMKQEPKRLLFPALRFVESRQVSNTQRLQLRHWLLLAARCAVVGLAALALARPNVASAALGGWLIAGGWGVASIFLGVLALVAWTRNMSRFPVLLAFILMLAAGTLSGAFGIAAWSGGGVMLAREEMPVAAVVIVDTAPHMNYRHENRTRLEVARETARWLIGELPRESSIAVLDTSRRAAAFAVDAATAARNVDRLKIYPAPESLPETVERARALLASAEKPQREIYIVTDLSRTSWPEDSAIKSLISPDDAQKPAIYVIDVGVNEPINVSLDRLTLSAESLPGGAELGIETAILQTGSSGQRTVDLLLEEQDPTLPMLREDKLILPDSVKRGSMGVELTDSPVPVRFALRSLSPGVHHGSVRLVGEDGLDYDDVRYFSIEVEEPRPLLCVGGPNVNIRDFAEAIAPQALRDRQESRFTCDVIAAADLSQSDLTRYRAVALLDPPPLSTETWERLASFVRGGGGLAIFLGTNAQPAESFRELAVREILGGRIGGALSAPARSAGVYFTPAASQHPVFAMFRGQESSVPWDQFPVVYYWPLDQTGTDARVVAAFSDGRPAMVETTLGRGRVLTFTTPGCEPLQPGGRPAWNELWAGEDAWPWFVLLNESFRYLARFGEGKLNYAAGETAVLQNDAERHPLRYTLFSPQGDVQEVTAGEDTLVLRGNLAPGTWRLRGTREGPVLRGFSTNLAPASTELQRIDPARLAHWFGEKGFQFARSREELRRVVGEQRTGQELYPYIILLLVFILALEHILANRFYRRDVVADRPAIPFFRSLTTG